jgi:hypothetical protein
MSPSSKIEPFILHFESPFGSDYLLIEDDGRVCYAYAYALDGDDQILGDVWLYNRCATPDAPEWDKPDDLPFANPREFVATDLDFQPPASPSDISVSWLPTAAGDFHVQVYIRDQLIARLGHGTKPGWSILAGKDGPLAKVLTLEMKG